MFCRRFRHPAVIALLLCVSAPALAGYKDDIGYTALQVELGSALPTGSGVAMTQVEAKLSGNYLPDTNSAEFAGKTFTIKSGTTGVSDHGTTVGNHFYGTSTSIAPGTENIDLYEANNWIGSGLLNFGLLTPTAPKVESRDTANFSWIGSTGSESSDAEILRRFDFTIARDDYIAVVGLNNGSASTIPNLLGHSYNSIAVGLTNGDHSTGATTIEVAGRVKPDIVTPLTLTSYGTPTVGAAAALLIDKARSDPSLTNAAKAQTVKALLLAGATKSQFPGWNRTTTRPLDAHYGAGQLNILNSYHILVAGNQPASASAVRSSRGWDFTTTASASRRYFFDVPAGSKAATFSAILTWHRVVADGIPGPSWGSPTSTVPDLSLKLHAASGFTLGALVDQSASAIDNVEHVFQKDLAPGRYALEVTAGTTGISYGIAWDAQLVPLQVVTIGSSGSPAAEFGAVPGTFTVSRTTTQDFAQPVTVNYFVSGGSATSGVDYIALPGTVTIPANTTSATISVTPVADTEIEGSETVAVTLASGANYALGAAITGSLVIEDKPGDQWKSMFFEPADWGNPAIVGDDADPDGDGSDNLTENALGLDPTQPDASGLPTIQMDAEGLLFTYRRLKSATDIAYKVEVTTDLTAGWQSGAAFTQPHDSSDQGDVVLETVRISPPSDGGGKQFVRLHVTRQ